MAFTKTVATLTAGWTQATATTALDTAMQAAGLGAPYDSYTVTTDNSLVYRVIMNGSAKGTVYIRIVVGATQFNGINHWDTWNTGTHAGTGGSLTGGAITYSTASNLVFTSFNGNEGKFVIIENNSLRTAVGYMRPSNKSPAYDESQYRYAFLPSNAGFSTFYCAAAQTSSYTMTGLSLVSIGGNSTYDGGKRWPWPGRGLYSSSNNIGMIGFFGTDVLEAGYSGFAAGDDFEVTAGAEVYYVGAISGNMILFRTV